MAQYNWPKIIEVVTELLPQAGDFSDLAAAVNARVQIPRRTLLDGLKRELGLEQANIEMLKLKLLPEGERMGALATAMLELLRKSPNEAFSLLELCERFDRAPTSVQMAADELKDEGYNVVLADDRSVAMPSTVAPTSWEIPVTDYLDDNLYRFGYIADSHLCNRHARLDVHESVYDRFGAEGIRLVLHGGNLPAGESNLNRHELLVTGIEGQLMYIAKNYPYRDGIETWFITGDCHEGWWSKLGFDVGRYMANTFADEGRGDLKWIGHIEADMPLDGEQSTLRVAHPGGGTAYALSYTAQKYVESLQGGEKPSILLLGHFHKYDACYIRNVFTLQMGTGCDQTIWMRKRRLEAHVGAGIIEVRMNRMGGIAEVIHRWWPYYDHGYYKAWDFRSSWKEHLAKT